jgi:anthraniloyl-CoA monooxygenase
VWPADLVLAADGVNSACAKRFAEHVPAHLDWRKCKFAWLGTTKPMTAFTFVFQPTSGPVPGARLSVREGRGTWIVECREETWRRAGLDKLDEAQTVASASAVRRTSRRPSKLLINRSIWRTFPTIRCGAGATRTSC